MDPVDNNIKFALSIKDPNVVFYKYNYQVINGCKLIPETTFKRGYNE
jgi:hypothetical protein